MQYTDFLCETRCSTISHMIVQHLGTWENFVSRENKIQDGHAPDYDPDTLFEDMRFGLFYSLNMRLELFKAFKIAFTENERIADKKRHCDEHTDTTIIHVLHSLMLVHDHTVPLKDFGEFITDGIPPLEMSAIARYILSYVYRYIRKVFRHMWDTEISLGKRPLKTTELYEYDERTGDPPVFADDIVFDDERWSDFLGSVFFQDSKAEAIVSEFLRTLYKEMTTDKKQAARNIVIDEATNEVAAVIREQLEKVSFTPDTYDDWLETKQMEDHLQIEAREFSLDRGC